MTMEALLEACPATLIRSSSRTCTSTEQCSVCIQPFRRGQWLRTLPCNHSFHSKCIDRWLLGQHRCPLCNKNPLPDKPSPDESAPPPCRQSTLPVAPQRRDHQPQDARSPNGGRRTIFLSPDDAADIELAPYRDGVVIASLTTSAAAAGLCLGDHVMLVEGERFASGSCSDARRLLREAAAPKPRCIWLTIQRPVTRTVLLTAAQLAECRLQLRQDGVANHMVVAGLLQTDALHSQALREGDAVLQIDGSPVVSARAAQKLLQRDYPSDKVSLEVSSEVYYHGDEQGGGGRGERGGVAQHEQRAVPRRAAAAAPFVVVGPRDGAGAVVGWGRRARRRAAEAHAEAEAL